MSARSYRVKELAEISGVTVRTLHHYDAIGLLTPSTRTDAGYRLYGPTDLLRLQQILLWRERSFALETIKDILDDADFDLRNALIEQRRELIENVRRTDAKIHSIDTALAALKGDDQMTASKLFDGFDPYEEETRQRWGDTDAYRESARRTQSYTKQDWTKIRAENANILDRLAAKHREGAPADRDDVVELAEQHRLHIDRWFYSCSRTTHVALGEMYRSDERLAASIDNHGKGLTAFLVEAIRANR